jgi:D-proline reductase (dithiol) PrdB
MDLSEFRERYDPWLEEVRPFLEKADWKTAFRTYPYLTYDEAPWSPFGGELGRSKLALLGTAGVYLAGEQPPFRAADIEGDWTFREIPGEVALGRLAIAHDHYDHTSARLDLNAVYPLERLRELVQDGTIGTLAERHYSVSGYCTRPDLIVEQTAPAIVASLKKERVDAVLHVPV